MALYLLVFSSRHDLGGREEKSDMVVSFASSDWLNYSATLSHTFRPYEIRSMFDGKVSADNGVPNDEVAETQSSCSRC
jgi:hypothetical protein